MHLKVHGEVMSFLKHDAHENLRKQSDDYIADIAKKVDIHIKGEEYEGKLPQEAVKTGFNSKERILAKILSNNLGVKIISSMYRH